MTYRRGLAVLGATMAVAGASLLAAVASGTTAVAAPASSGATLAPAAASTCDPADVDVVARNANLTSVTAQLAAGSSGVTCDVSLHSYQTQGPTWATSGTQTFLGYDSVRLTTSPQTLTVPASSCYGQTELVIGTTRHDGTDGALPHYPDGVFDSWKVVARWHGGTPCASPSTSPSASVSPTATATGSPTGTTSASSSVSPTSTATGTVSPTATNTVGPQASVSPLAFQQSPSPSPTATVLGEQFTNTPGPGVGPTALPFTGQPVSYELGLGAGLVVVGAALLGLVAWRRSASRF